VGGDEGRLRDWLDDGELPIRVVPGAEPLVRAVGIRLRGGGEILLRS
jgi:hypothetical protein